MSVAFKLLACLLLICALTGYIQSAEQPHMAIVFIIATVIAALGYFAGDDP